MPRALHACLLGLAAFVLTGCGHLSQPAVTAPKHADSSGQTLKPAARLKPGKAGGRENTAAIAEAHAHYATGVILELSGEVSPALEEFTKAGSADPGSEWLMLDVTRRLIQQKKLDEAARLLEMAAMRPDVTGPVLARLGMVYSQLGRIPESVEASRAAIRKAPATLVPYQSLFVVYMEGRQPRQALDTLEQAVAVRNPSTEFLLGLSDLYTMYGVQVPEAKKTAGEKALELLQKARNQNPNDPLLKLRIADGLSRMGESQGAKEIYDSLLTLEDRNPILVENVRGKLATIYLKADDRTNAVAQLKALTVSDPTNPRPYYFLGSLALENQEPEQAVDYLSKTLILSPEFEQAYYELANTFLVLEKPREAMDILEKARKKFAAGFLVEFLSGITASRLKDYDSALRYFTSAEVTAAATDTNRLNHFFYFQLGVTYEQKKDFDQAARAFEKALELSPGFTEAMNYLGYMWADQGVELDKALELLTKAVAAEPDNAAYLDSLGWVYFKRNQLSEALEHVSKAVDLSKEPDATLLEHLGDIFAAMGQTANAREAWEKSCKITPSEAVKNKIQGLADGK